MNVASAVPAARFSALLVEGEKGLGLEGTLREQGCSVRRATSRATAQEGLDSADLIVITGTLPDEEVAEIVGRGALGASVLVVTDKTDLAIKVAKLGASTIQPTVPELVSSHIGQLLAMADLKRKLARQSAPASTTSPNSGIVQRRSTPLPKEATPDALEALIEAAENLVPMHRFQRVYVDYALRRFGGNKVHTAAALGIDRRTIQRWARARAEQTTPATTSTVSSS